MGGDEWCRGGYDVLINQWDMEVYIHYHLFIVQIMAIYNSWEIEPNVPSSHVEWINKRDMHKAQKRGLSGVTKMHNSSTWQHVNASLINTSLFPIQCSCDLSEYQYLFSTPLCTPPPKPSPHSSPAQYTTLSSALPTAPPFHLELIPSNDTLTCYNNVVQHHNDAAKLLAN
jgi:hypothetical protein